MRFRRETTAIRGAPHPFRPHQRPGPPGSRPRGPSAGAQETPLCGFPAGTGFLVQPGDPSHPASTAAVPHQSPRDARPVPGPPRGPPRPSRAGPAQEWLLGRPGVLGGGRSGSRRVLIAPGRAEPEKSRGARPPGHLPSKCPAPRWASWRRCRARGGWP